MGMAMVNGQLLTIDMCERCPVRLLVLHAIKSLIKDIHMSLIKDIYVSSYGSAIMWISVYKATELK